MEAAIWSIRFDIKIPQAVQLDHRSQFPLYDFLFIFEKTKKFLFFLSWHFQALLLRNNAKCCKIARIVNKIYIFQGFSLSIIKYFNIEGDNNSRDIYQLIQLYWGLLRNCVHPTLFVFYLSQKQFDIFR